MRMLLPDNFLEQAEEEIHNQDVMNRSIGYVTQAITNETVHRVAKINVITTYGDVEDFDIFIKQ